MKQKRIVKLLDKIEALRAQYAQKKSKRLYQAIFRLECRLAKLCR